MLQLGSAQETANQYATSLANLQMVLEQFQHGNFSHTLLFIFLGIYDLLSFLTVVAGLSSTMFISSLLYHVTWLQTHFIKTK